MNFITTQKPLLIVAAVALTTVLSAASAFAQDATPDYARAQTAVSTTSRAAVQAEGAARPRPTRCANAEPGRSALRRLNAARPAGIDGKRRTRSSFANACR